MTITDDLELYCLCEREYFGGFLEKEAPPKKFRIQRGIEQEDVLRVEGGRVVNPGGEVKCSTHEPLRQTVIQDVCSTAGLFWRRRKRIRLLQ